MNHSKYNPDRHKRKSIRLPSRDYAANGAYFITKRSDQHQTLFEIPELRDILQETWNDLPKQFPSVSLDEFIIMPDHIHFILWLNYAEQNTPTLGSVVGAYKSIAAVTWLRHIETNNLIPIPWSHLATRLLRTRCPHRGTRTNPSLYPKQSNKTKEYRSNEPK